MKLNITYVWKDALSSFAALMIAVSRREASAVSTQSSLTTHSVAQMRRTMIALLAALPALVFGLGVALPAYASGNYGPDTCLQGWVWREAVPGDHVCVTPATRAQATYDNSQAAARRDSLRLWHTTYTIPVNGSTTNDVPQYRLYGDHINVGPVTVQLRRNSDNALLRAWTVNATSTSSAPGGQFRLDTGISVCSRPPDSYFRVFDPISTRWSDPYSVKTICYTL